MGRVIYLVAGEVSGDIHAADVMRGIREKDSEVTFKGLGGSAMTALSDQVEDWLERAAVMGIWEVLKHYSFFKEKMDQTLADVLATRPDTLLLVDYPGFNLRLAAAVKKQAPEIRIVQYVCPQVWAWKKGRIPKIAACVDVLMCLFPFEPQLFSNYEIDARFVGHPLVDELAEKRIDVKRDDCLVGLFPGSREREVATLFPVMLGAAQRIFSEKPNVRFEVPGASPALTTELRRQISQTDLPIVVTEGGSHSLMQRAGCGVLASGTATLEAAFFGMPYCLMYKLAWSTYQIAKVVVKIRFIGIVNILADREVVREFIQDAANEEAVSGELLRLLGEPDHRAEVEQGMREAVESLGDEGVRDRLASIVLEHEKGPTES